MKRLLSMLLALSVFVCSMPQLVLPTAAAEYTLSEATIAAKDALEALILRDDTTKADVLGAVITAIGNTSITVTENALEYRAGDDQNTGSVKGGITLAKGTDQENVTVDLVLPKTGDVLGTISLMSAARKNHYIRDNNTNADMHYNVSPEKRRFTRIGGLADADGVSFKLVGTERYLQVSGNKLVIAAVSTDEQMQAATFYASQGARPVWAEVYDGDFEQYATYADRTAYIKANITTNALYIGSIDASSESDRLSASFKKTADNTDVVEGLRGAVYYPSYSYNAPQFFKFYDSAIIERDMQYAQSLGINAFRIWVSYEYWLEDPVHFKKGYDDFMRLAEKYGIKILTSLFEGCSTKNDYNVRTYSQSYSVTSPAAAIFDDQTRWNEPKQFVDWFMQYYKDDTRHLAIEIYNEPWGTRENLAAELLKYIVTKQGKVAISYGTAPSGNGLHSIAYSVQEGVDIIQYHANFPANTTNFANNAKTKMKEAESFNLPLYCTEVQWVGGPGNPYDSHYENLAPTCNELSEDGKWAPFYWTLMVHPCYLPENRQHHLINGIFQEDGSVWSTASAAAIAPEKDTSDLIENRTDPYTQYYYAHLYSDDFMDDHGYKWTLDNTLSVENEQLCGIGTALADLTKFANFTASVKIAGTDAGLLFRATDADNGLYAEISADALTLYKLKDGEKIRLATGSLAPQEINTLEITANGASLTARVGEVSVSATDADYATGLIGLHADSSATFDDLLASSAAVQNPVPAAPEKVTAARTAQGVKLSWNTVSGADSYTVLRAESADGEYTQIAKEITEAGYLDTAADPQTAYYYAVIAVNQNGESIASPAIKCYSKPDVGVDIKMPNLTTSNGLVWYKFDQDASSTEAVSSVVSNRSAALKGTFLPDGGRDGGAFWFDGISDSIRINAENTNSGLLHDAYTRRTFSFYMCPYTLDGKQMLMKTGGDLNGVAVRINEGALEVAVVTGAVSDPSTQYISDAIPLSDDFINRWTHVAVTFNRGVVSVYLDGELVSQGSSTATTVSSASRAAYLGACGDEVSAFRDYDGKQCFSGLIDDFRVYKTEAIPAVALGTAAKVTASPESGAVAAGTAVTLSTQTADAQILYSLDDGKTWKTYSTPIQLTSLPQTIKAYATGTAYFDGEISTFTYQARPIVSTTVQVNAVKLNVTKATLTVNSTKTLKATVSPSNATNKTVSWKSSNPKIVSVSASGKIKANAAGKAIITATAGGKTATCIVTVKPAKVKKVKLKASGKKLTVQFNKAAGAKYYQLLIYRNGKKIKTVPKLKKTTYKYAAKKRGNYQIKICACTKVSKILYKSAYVKSKKVKIK